MQKFNAGGSQLTKCQFAAASFQIIQGDYGAGRTLPRNHAGEVGADKPGATGYGSSFRYLITRYHGPSARHNT